MRVRTPLPTLRAAPDGPSRSRPESIARGIIRAEPGVRGGEQRAGFPELAQSGNARNVEVILPIAAVQVLVIGGADTETTSGDNTFDGDVHRARREDVREARFGFLD